jgi:polyhydroxyalkanoate synthase subunit PhaC
MEWMSTPMIIGPIAKQQDGTVGAGLPVAANLLKEVALSTSHDLDRYLHMIQGRMGFGLSPISPWLAFLDWAAHRVNAPGRSVSQALNAIDAVSRLSALALGRTTDPVVAPAPADHRFSDPAWQTWPYNVIQQQFLLTEQWWERETTALPGVSRSSERIVNFCARQMLDAWSPTNFPWLNPEVTAATWRSGGGNLIAGWQNFLADWLAVGRGRPVEPARFVIGQDLAATRGKVVARTALMELIQYAPTTPQVRAEPILIVPAWIMKYYILDLSPHNSLIRYLVDRGHTVFAISWRNPGPEMGETDFDAYRTEGVMAALDAIADINGPAPVNAVGYCLGGTLLSVTAAAMARDGDRRLGSVTLLAAQTDFTEAGELQLFITEDQVAFLADVMAEQGYLDSQQMAGAFQLLRSNDLIWSRAIRSYLLGEHEMPNDLMAWNQDGTRLPARMHAEYLQRLFLDNDLAEGRFPAGGRPVALEDIRLPCFVVGTEADHIAPWRSVYKFHLMTETDITFVLASGGHNAGIVSEPGHPHRHYRIRKSVKEAIYIPPEDWLDAAERRDGSWWEAWSDWLTALPSCGQVAPPATGSDSYPVLAEAPGDYVHQH